MYNIIANWKKEHGHISYTTVDGIDFYFRLIKRNEYETLRKLYSDSLEIDEKIAQLCVLDPTVDDWQEDIYAGFANTLARVILEESTEVRRPNSPSNYVQHVVNMEYNKVASSFDKQMPAIILRAFPAYRLEEIENLPMRRQVEIYAQALWVLNEIEPNPYYISFDDGEE